MIKVIVNICFIISTTSYLCINYAQSIPGARQIALAHSDIALSDDVFSLFNNPSGLAQLNSREIGFFYSPSPFGIEELANGYLAYSEPTSLGNFSLGAVTYGFDLYRENRFLLGYSNKVSDQLLLGITTFYHSINIKRYGSASQINLSVGGLFLLQNIFSLGFSLHNPLRFSDSEITLPTSYHFGITYQPFERTSLNAALSKEIDFPFSFSFGIEYPLIKVLVLRFGVQNEPVLYNGGLGIIYSYFRLNYSISSHQELGLTHQFDLIISFD